MNTNIVKGKKRCVLRGFMKEVFVIKQLKIFDCFII